MKYRVRPNEPNFYENMEEEPFANAFDNLPTIQHIEWQKQRELQDKLNQAFEEMR